MKRILSILLILVLALSVSILLIACGDDDDSTVDEGKSDAYTPSTDCDKTKDDLEADGYTVSLNEDFDGNWNISATKTEDGIAYSYSIVYYTDSAQADEDYTDANESLEAFENLCDKVIIDRKGNLIWIYMERSIPGDEAVE